MNKSVYILLYVWVGNLLAFNHLQQGTPMLKLWVNSRRGELNQIEIETWSTIETLQAHSLIECGALCTAEDQCEGFTYGSDSNVGGNFNCQLGKIVPLVTCVPDKTYIRIWLIKSRGDVTEAESENQCENKPAGHKVFKVVGASKLRNEAVSLCQDLGANCSLPILHTQKDKEDAIMATGDPCSNLGFWIGVSGLRYEFYCTNEQCRNELHWEDGDYLEVDMFSLIGPIGDNPSKPFFRYRPRDDLVNQVGTNWKITALCMCLCD